MGKLKGITINTDPAAEAHICAEDDAAIYQSIVGSDGVMMIGQIWNILGHQYGK